MTMDEYVAALHEMSVRLDIRWSKARLEQYAKTNYTRNVLLIKPSWFYTLFRGPWHFLCTPFNKLLNWIGDHMPLYDYENRPMDDDYIHFTATLKMAGFVPLQDYGWHVVDAKPVCNMEPELFKKYFRSQRMATRMMPMNKAEEFLDALYSDYVEKHHIYEFGKYHRFTTKQRDKILNIIAKADPAKSYISIDHSSSAVFPGEKYRANFNIDDTRYLYISVAGPLATPEGAPKVIVKTSWTKIIDDNDVFKHQTWFNGDCIGWLTRRMDELEPEYKKAHPEFSPGHAED